MKAHELSLLCFPMHRRRGWYVVLVDAHMLAEVIVSAEILPASGIRALVSYKVKHQHGHIRGGELATKTYVFRTYVYSSHAFSNAPL